MNYYPWFIVWLIMAATVLVLAAWRKTVTRNEDDSLHVSEATTAAIPRQVELTQKLAKIDRLGKGATIVAVVYGLALFGVYFYHVWTNTNIQQ
jgi:hypothetical protein